MPASNRSERFRAASLVPALVFVLALAGSIAMGSPCSQTPSLLAGAGAGVLGRAGRSQRILTFNLAKPGRVWAEATGLSGLDGEDLQAAPEVFLDDNYLGPLLPDVGSFWRSPRALTLAAGPHSFLIRCAEPGGEGPVLRWRTLRILGDPRCLPQRRKHAERPLLALDYDAGPLPCGAALVRHDWPARLKGRSLLISDSDLHAVDGGPLVRLAQGQVWRGRLRIPLGPDGQALPLTSRFSREADGRVRFWLGLDHDVAARASISAVGYRPGHWEPLTLALCSGELSLAFAKTPVQRFPCPEPRISFDVSARDLAVSLAPFR